MRSRIVVPDMGGAFGGCGSAFTRHGQDLYVRNRERLRVVGGAGVPRIVLLHGPWPIASCYKQTLDESIADGHSKQLPTTAKPNRLASPVPFNLRRSQMHTSLVMV